MNVSPWATGSAGNSLLTPPGVVVSGGVAVATGVVVSGGVVVPPSTVMVSSPPAPEKV